MADSDRRELAKDLGVAMRANNRALQSTVWTAMPGIIQSFDPAKRTCSVQVSILSKVLGPTGTTRDVKLPLLVDCPVLFPGGGGFVLTFPLRTGDECLVLFSARCIDSWWHSGGVQVQNELRMHDLSDGFVLPGPRSLPAVEPAISATDVELRNEAGTSRVAILPNGNVRVEAQTVTVDAQVAQVFAPNIYLTGAVHITGTLDVTEEVTAADFITPTLPSYNDHTHTGVRNGSDHSGPPTPGT